MIYNYDPADPDVEIAMIIVGLAGAAIFVLVVALIGSIFMPPREDDASSCTDRFEFCNTHEPNLSVHMPRGTL